MSELTQVERDIKALLHDSDVSAGKISRNGDITLATVSRLRNGKADLNNVSFTNIKKLHKVAQQLGN